MKAKNLLVVFFILITMSSFATSNGLYTIISKLEGNAIVGKETTFKIHYSWLTDIDRTGKIIYHIIGTNCNGEINLNKRSGFIPVSGEAEIKCKFDRSAIFNSDTQLKLYDGHIDKEQSNIEHGKITVTVQ